MWSKGSSFITQLTGAYLLQLAMESVVPDTQTYKQCNGGWTSENGTVAIKWESDIENIKRSWEINILPTCTNLSVIVIDKPIGLGGTVYTSTSIFV